MEKENIRLIATDLDGTLLNSKKEVPLGFEDFVLSHPDISFVIASGRQYFNMIELFPSVKDQLVFIAENGGLIYYRDELIYSNPMLWDDVKLCIDRFNKPGQSVVILCGEKSAYILEDSSEESFKNSYLYYERFEKVSCFDDIEDNIIKIAIFVEEHRANELFGTIEPINDRLDVLLSGACWIDVANRSVSKGAAIKFLQERYCIDRSESLAFGDYLNDYALLEECDISYAMENSHPDLFNIAKYKAPSNEDCGVMRILQKIFSR